jgi:hypothetical protein
MASGKKQHYVPQFYQKGFANSEEMLWVYDRKMQAYRFLHPKSICVEDDLYSIRPKDGPTNRAIETKVLHRIEGTAATAIKSAVSVENITENHIEIIAYFIGLQFTRLPTFMRMVLGSYQKYLDEFARVNFTDVNRTAKILERYQRDTGDQSEMSAETMTDMIVNKKVTIGPTEMSFLQQMFRHAEVCAKRLHESSWTFLEAPGSSGFVVCDRPFVSVPPEGVRFPTLSYGTPGVVNYFPLSKRFCLRFEHDKEGLSFQNLDSAQVRTINLNIAANSERFVMGSSEAQLRSIVE